MGEEPKATAIDAASLKRLDNIAEHVIEACYLAHEHRAELLVHILKMAFVEIEALRDPRAYPSDSGGRAAVDAKRVTQ